MNIPINVWRTTVIDYLDDAIASAAFAVEMINFEIRRAVQLSVVGGAMFLVVFGVGYWQFVVAAIVAGLLYRRHHASVVAKSAAGVELNKLLVRLVAAKHAAKDEAAYSADTAWLEAAEKVPCIDTDTTRRLTALPTGSLSAASTYALSSKLARLADLCLMNITPSVAGYFVSVSNYTRDVASTMNPHILPNLV